MSASDRATSDHERFENWVRQHGPIVRWYLGATLGRADVAEELTQEVFCRAWQARRRYREQGGARAYLLKIADRLMIDHARRAGWETGLDETGWQLLEPAGGADDPVRLAMQNETREQLARVLGELSLAQRRVLLLRYYGQLSFAEIAAALGCPLNTALSHCRRGLSRAREIIQKSPQTGTKT